MNHRNLSAALTAAAMGLVLFVEASAAPVRTQAKTGAGDAATAMRGRLDAKIDVDFQKVPLADALKVIGDMQPGLKLTVDPDMSPIAPATPRVTVKVSQLPVKDVLDIILGKELVYQVEATRVVITDPALLGRNMPSRRYDVRGLLAAAVGPPSPSNVAAFGELINVVQRVANAMVDPAVAAWSDEGGPATCYFVDGTLIITQTSRGHERIAELLEELGRALAARPARRPADAEPKALAETQKRLKARVDLDAQETTLAEILRTLNDGQPGLNLVVDPYLPPQAAAALASPVTLKATQSPLEPVLKQLLKTDLLYSVRPGYVLVTTRDKAANGLLLAVYPLAAGRGQPPSAEQLDPLIRLILRTVSGTKDSAVAMWSDGGGPASINPFGGMLVVVQTRRGHEMVEECLKAGRRSTGPRSR